MVERTRDEDLSTFPVDDKVRNNVVPITSCPEQTTDTPTEERPWGADGVPQNWKPGDVILDLYEVRRLSEESPFAEGGMGRVNRVWHRGWQMDLAVKSVNPQYLQRPGAVEHFQREAEVWVNKLNLHPNLVFCYYVRLLGGLPRIFVEYVEGGDLAHWIESGQLYEGGHQAALARILDIAIQFAWGLHAIHAQGLVHQDVKPRNVLLTRDGIAKVTDFGIARARAAAEAGEAGENLRPDVTALAGTRSYQSPEQAAGERLTLATDVWSWGVSILDLFAGKVERGFGAAAALALEQYAAADNREDRCPVMPPAVLELLRHCFQRRPEDRAQSMLDVAAVLRESYAQVTGQPYPREWVEPEEALADSLNNRALSLYESLDRRQEAEQKWQEALRIDPLHPEAVYNLGLLQWRSAQMTDEQLLQKLQEARTSCLTPPRLDYLLGLVHLERNDCAGAIEVLSRLTGTEAASVERVAALDQAKGLLANSTRLERALTGHTGKVQALAWSPDARFVCSASADRTLRLWEVTSGTCTEVFEDHPVGPTAVAWDNEGFVALAAGLDEAKQGKWMPPLAGAMLALTAPVASIPRNEKRLLTLFDASSGLCVQSFGTELSPEELQAKTPVTAIALSPDCSLALTAHDDHTLMLWEVSTSLCLRILTGHTDLVDAVAFSPDGCLALSSSADDTLRLWEVSSGRCLRVFEVPAQADTPAPEEPDNDDVPWALAWIPDGRWALSTGPGGTLHLWDIATGERRALLGHAATVHAIALSPDGRFALTGSADRTLRLWVVATGRCLRTLEGHEGTVTSLAWSPDGRFALSGSADKSVRLWRLAAAEPHVPLAPSRPWVGPTQVYSRHLHDARAALAAGEPTRAASLLARARQEPGGLRGPEALEVARQVAPLVSHRKFKEGWERQRLGGHGEGHAVVAISPDGLLAVSGGWDQTLRLWEIATGTTLHTVPDCTDPPTSVVFTADGRFILCGDRNGLVQMRTAPTCELCRSFDGNKADDPVLPGVTMMAKLMESGKRTHRNPARTRGAAWVAPSPDGQHVLSGTRDGAMFLWDADSGACLRSFWSALSDSSDGPLTVVLLSLFFLFLGAACALTPVMMLCCHPAVGLTADKTSQVDWNTPFPLLFGGVCLVVAFLPLRAGFALLRHRSRLHSASLTSVAWSTDGSLILTGSEDRTLRSWEIASSRRRHTFRGHTEAVTAVAFSPDNRLALSGSDDRTVRLWEIATGFCQRTFEGHTGRVTAVAFSPDGASALSASADHTLRLWDLATGCCLGVFEGHTATVTAVAWSPDGCVAVSSGYDDTLRVWQLDWELNPPLFAEGTIAGLIPTPSPSPE